MNPSLRKNSNYPPMSDSEWARAPFNQVDPPEKTFNVSVSYSISRDVDVTTTEYDEEGCNGAGEMYNPLEAYSDSYKSIEEIITFAKDSAAYFLANHNNALGNKFFLHNMLDSCEGWVVDEGNAEQI